MSHKKKFCTLSFCIIAIPLVSVLIFYLLLTLSIAHFLYLKKDMNRTEIRFLQAIKEKNFFEAKTVLLEINPYAAYYPTYAKRFVFLNAQLEAAVKPIRDLFDFHSKIKRGKYSIPPHLASFKVGFGNTIKVKKPFYIQHSEITVAQFRLYVEELTGAERRRLQAKLIKDGKPLPNDYPVETISWHEANDYTQWLAKKTLWKLALPSSKQWLAATILYGEYQPNIKTTNNEKPLRRVRGERDHLLGNLQEWSSAPCQIKSEKTYDYYYVLGASYFTDSIDMTSLKTLSCKSKDVEEAGVGFRLIRLE
jgi:hypothetical protein